MSHERRVLPLMQRAHRLDEMVPNAPLEGIVQLDSMFEEGELPRESSLLIEGQSPWAE
jgi:hypothetical protein